MARVRQEYPSFDELVAVLRHSFLPTVIVEGADEAIVFRPLEESLGVIGASVMPVGGRQMALALFKERATVSELAKRVFIVDRDLWVFTGVPMDYQTDDLLCTWGYSIENDIFVDGKLDTLMSLSEREEFGRDLTKFVRWFALAVHRNLGGSESPLSYHPREVIEDVRFAELTELRGSELYPQELYDGIVEEYTRLVRGKSLLQVLMIQLSRTGRSVHHSYRSVLEMVANMRGPRLNELYERAATALKA